MILRDIVLSLRNWILENNDERSIPLIIFCVSATENQQYHYQKLKMRLFLYYIFSCIGKILFLLYSQNIVFLEKKYLILQSIWEIIKIEKLIYRHEFTDVNLQTWIYRRVEGRLYDKIASYRRIYMLQSVSKNRRRQKNGKEI